MERSKELITIQTNQIMSAGRLSERHKGVFVSHLINYEYMEAKEISPIELSSTPPPRAFRLLPPVA
jgi:hypothetical protein